MTEKKITHIRAYQIQVNPYRFSENTGRIRQLFIDSPANLSVFPEASTSGFPYRRLEEISSANQVFLTEIQEIAANYRKGTLLPLLIKDNEHFFNRQYLITPDGGIAATYDKIHLIGALHEDRFLRAGSKPVCARFPGNNGEIKIGLATCYDLRFPELFRDLVLNRGADVIIIPSMWPREREAHFRILAPARAVENQTPVLTCNGVNECGRINLCGLSGAYNEKGETLHLASNDREEEVDLLLNPDHTRKWRESFPALRDARLHRLD